MASPCEVLISCKNKSTAKKIARIVQNQAQRVESKFSRYRKDNIIYKLNNASGKPVKLDAETAKLIDYADVCYKISDGLFDISSGILGKIWDFKSHDKVPGQEEIDELLSRVGWHKVKWQTPVLMLQKGMQVDLGGIAKEYAVDHTFLLLKDKFNVPVLVNFGGDLVCNRPPDNTEGWQVAIEDDNFAKIVNLSSGALATSGDKNRYVIHEGYRLSHIINPKTGWPEKNSPTSVTVKAPTCLEAGIMATIAMLHGEDAELFLQKQGVMFELEPKK